MLLATVAGSKVYPGRPHVLMIDRSLAPCRNAYMRPENMDIGSGVVCIGKYIYIFEFFHYTNPAVLPTLGQHMFVLHQWSLLVLLTYFSTKCVISHHFQTWMWSSVQQVCYLKPTAVTIHSLKKGNDVKLCHCTYSDMMSVFLVIVLVSVLLFYGVL